MSRYIEIIIISFFIPIISWFWEKYFLKKGKSKKATTTYTLIFTSIILIVIYFSIHFFFGKYIR